MTVNRVAYLCNYIYITHVLQYSSVYPSGLLDTLYPTDLATVIHQPSDSQVSHLAYLFVERKKSKERCWPGSCYKGSDSVRSGSGWVALMFEHP